MPRFTLTKCHHIRTTLDENARQVTCDECGAVIPHWDALVSLNREMLRFDSIWESVFAAAPVAMGLTDSHGVFVECNSELIFMLGMDPTGKHFNDITAPHDVRSGVEAFQRVLDGTSPMVRVLKHYIHADGHEVQALVQCTPIRDEDGEISMFSSVMLPS